MAASVHHKQVRSPASLESLTRSVDVLILCKEGRIESLRRMLDDNPAILYEKDPRGRGIAYYATLSQSLPMCQFIYGKDPNLFNSQEGIVAFREALFLKNHSIIDWFLKIDPMHILQRDENGDTSIIWACKKKFVDVVDLLLRKNPNLIYDKDLATGSTPFLVACGLADLQLAKRIYRENSWVINFRDKFEATSVLKALQASDGIEVVRWLFSEVGAFVLSEEEVGCFVKIIPTLGPRIVSKVMLASQMHNFVSHARIIKRCVKDQRVLRHLEDLLSTLPREFEFRGQVNTHLEGDALIEYYNMSIEDIPSIENPCDSLMVLFNALTEKDYLLNMQLGEEKVMFTTEDATVAREGQLRVCDKFFIAIRNEKPDQSIPVGKELFYYIHLKRILKHLVQFLENSKEPQKKSECFTYLKMMTEVSETCYTNYSTMLHSMYAALKDNSSFSEASTQEDLLWKQFSHEMTGFYRRKIEARAFRSFDGLDAHEASVIQKFFNESNIPYLGGAIVFEQIHQFPALLGIRKEILKIEDSDDSLGFMTDGDLYDETKLKFIDQFHRKINSIEFIYNGLKDFLVTKLNGSESARFLSLLNDWLEHNGIHSTERVLEYQETGAYIVKSEGLVEMLQQFRRRIEI